MKEKNLLAELAAYLFSHSDKETGRTPSERELAEHFGVSRGQIREALAILEAMRIVERRAKSGIYIDTKQASVEAMALFARAGLPLDPIQIYETVEVRNGMVDIPDRPGLGFTIDQQFLDAHAQASP